MSEAINATLDLDGIEVVAVSVTQGVAELVVQSHVDAGACRACGGIAGEAKERPQVLVRDLPISGRPVLLRWLKRRWRCSYCGATWTETHPQIPARARMTVRFKVHLASRAVAERNFTQVARAEGVSYDTVVKAHQARAELAQQNRSRPQPRILAIDEAAIRKGHSYCTVISDPERRYVLDTLQGRGVGALASWLSNLDDDVKHNIEAVVMDMFDPFHMAVTSALPDVVRIADKFHVLRNVNHALDRQRSRLQGRGRKTGAKRTLFRTRFLLLRAGDSLRPADRDRLDQIFFAHPELAYGWQLKESFRAFYDSASADEAADALEEWFHDAETSGIAEFVWLAGNLRRWKPQLLAYFTYRITNGYAEGITNRIKVIKRQGYGVPNFGSFRRRILIECGTPKLGIPA